MVLERTREPCDAPRPSRHSLVYFGPRLQRFKVLYYGRCVTRQAKTNAVVERLTHQPGSKLQELHSAEDLDLRDLEGRRLPSQGEHCRSTRAHCGIVRSS
jgi:hypothetical protein